MPTTVNKYIKKVIVHAPDKPSGHQYASGRKPRLSGTSSGDENKMRLRELLNGKKPGSIAICHAARPGCDCFILGIRLGPRRIFCVLFASFPVISAEKAVDRERDRIKTSF